MNGPYKSAAELLVSIGCATPAIRQGFGSLTFGRFNPLAPVNPHTRVGWEERYGLPWGSRGDHSSGAAVFAEYAARTDNPLNLTPFPYTVTDQDRSDANLLGTRAGEPSWSVIRKRFGAAAGGGGGEQNGGSDEQGEEKEECPPGWSCEPMTAEMVTGCRDGSLHCTAIRGLKSGDPRRWKRNSVRVSGKTWISYNPENSDPFKDVIVEPPVEPPTEPPVEPPTPNPPEPPTPPTLETTLELRLTDGGHVEVNVDEFGLMRVTKISKITSIFADNPLR